MRYTFLVPDLINRNNIFVHSDGKTALVESEPPYHLGYGVKPEGVVLLNLYTLMKCASTCIEVKTNLRAL